MRGYGNICFHAESGAQAAHFDVPDAVAADRPINWQALSFAFEIYLLRIVIICCEHVLFDMSLVFDIWLVSTLTVNKGLDGNLHS